MELGQTSYGSSKKVENSATKISVKARLVQNDRQQAVQHWDICTLTSMQVMRLGARRN